MGSDDHAPSHQDRVAELERIRACFDAATDLLFVISIPSAQIRDVNQTTCNLLGQNRETVLGSRVSQWFQDGTGRFETVMEELAGDDDGSATMVAELTDSADHRFSIELTVRCVSVGDEPLAVVVGRDITEREETESIRFKELFSVEDIQKIQDLFAEATGVASIITEPDGTPITRPSNFCRLCNDIIRQTPKGRKNCYKSDAVIGRQNPGGPIVQTCLSGGLWDAGASVTVGGRHIANWLIGQVRNDTQSEANAIQYAEEIGADVEAFLEAFREVPIMSKERFECIAETLFVFADQLSTLAYQNTQQARFITERKRVEKRLIEEKAFSDSVIDSLPGIFYLFDQDSRLQRWNDNFARVSGYSAEELLNKQPWDFFGEEDKQYIADQARLVFESGQVTATADFVSKTGRATPYIFTGVRVVLNDAPFLAGMGLDITDRKRAEAEREDLIAELEARNTELERFTYTVSHDLKSPLITIKGYIGMLAEDLHAGNTENVEEDIRRIANSADTMADLLRELLELSRIGRIVNPPTNVRVDDLAREAVEIVGGPISERGVQIQVEKGLPIAYGDRQRLLEVFQNLIENAVKYMGEQAEPTIRIGAELSEGMVLVHIEDNGIGIEPRYHERIFGLFDQLNVASEGTGIGLALVKRIVEIHGGRVWVESEGNGSGAKFCFTIPAPPDAY